VVTATVQVYIEHGHAHIVNATGHGTIPAAEVRDLFTRADNSDSEMARYMGRLYHRDNLRSALTLLDHQPGCSYSDQYVSCDELATDDPANPRPRCHLHPKEA
jgi:hypothetical protein